MNASSLPSARRTQEDRRAESDRRILGAAMRLIARNGAAGTTLADIGVAAGYSRGLPSERFGTKSALLDSLIGRTEEAFQEQLAIDVGDKTGLAAVEARIGAHLNGAARSPDAVRALYLLHMESLTVAPELHAHIAGLGRAYRDGFVRHLREARQAGEIAAHIDLQDHATVILGALRGMITQWLIDPSAIDLPAAKAVLVSMVRRALAPDLPGRKRKPARAPRGVNRQPASKSPRA
jgi:AcrR family transcriptional regulator